MPTLTDLSEFESAKKFFKDMLRHGLFEIPAVVAEHLHNLMRGIEILEETNKKPEK